MAEVRKVLGQSAPAAATATTLYTVPGATETVISLVTVANRSATPTSFRLWVDVNGAGDTDADYLYYDVPIQGNETQEIARGVTMDATDLLRCYATLATLTFGAFGAEIS